MAYPVDVPALIEVQMIGQLNLQRTRNVFHYALVVAGAPITDGATELSLFAVNWAHGMYHDIVAALSVQWVCTALQFQWVGPTRYRALQYQADDLGEPSSGAIAGPCLPSGNAARISTQGQLATRRHQGGQWYPAIPVSGAVNSELTGPQALLFDSVRADSLLSWHGNPANNYFPVHAHRLPAPAHGFEPPSEADLITTAIVRPEIRYQRRREIGKGE